jgi:hypothetical protein
MEKRTLKALAWWTAAMLTAGGLCAQPDEGAGRPHPGRRWDGKGPRAELRGEAKGDGPGWRGPMGGLLGPGGEGGAGHEGLIMRALANPRVAEELGISAEQVQALKDGLEKVRGEEQALRSELEAAAKEQARRLTEAKVDEAALMEAVEKAGALRTKLAKLWVRRLLLIKDTLTPEQVEKARSMIKEHAGQVRDRLEKPKGRDEDGAAK